MKLPKLILSDLDGTLVPEGEGIGPVDQEQIQVIQAQTIERSHECGLRLLIACILHPELCGVRLRV